MNFFGKKHYEDCLVLFFRYKQVLKLCLTGHELLGSLSNYIKEVKRSAMR